MKRPASFVKRLLLERIAEKEAVLARSGGPLAAALHAPRVVEAALEAVLEVVVQAVVESVIEAARARRGASGSTSTSGCDAARAVAGATPGAMPARRARRHARRRRGPGGFIEPVGPVGGRPDEHYVSFGAIPTGAIPGAMPRAIPGDMAGPEFTVTSGSVAAPARHPSSHVCGDAPASELHWYGAIADFVGGGYRSAPARRRKTGTPRSARPGSNGCSF